MEKYEAYLHGTDRTAENSLISFEFRPCRYVNDPYVVALNDRMVSINSVLTVDLTGQACSDPLGFVFYSGIGTFLLQHLIRIAKEKNIKGFTTDVLARNTAMLEVFSKAGYPIKTHLEYGVYELEIPFADRGRDEKPL